MEKNVGGYDRLARLVAGPVLLAVGLAAVGGFLTLAAGTLGLVLAAAATVVGGVFLVTGIIQKCPINSALGMDTYRGGERASDGTDDEGPAGRPS